MLLSGEVVGLQFVVVGLLGVLGLIGITVRKRKHKKVLRMMDQVNAPAAQVGYETTTQEAQIQANIPRMVDLDTGQPPGGSGPLGPL
jgi:hypothetical protein